MNIRLLDLNLEIKAIIDDYDSLYYEQKYDDIGSCTLTISAFSENFKMIDKNMILYLNEYDCWYIEEINIEKDVATRTIAQIREITFFIVKSPFLKYYLYILTQNF